MNLSARSYEKELLDGDDIPFADITRNMKELEIINTWLGGHRTTVKGFEQLAANARFLTVCETGCGSGDNLLAIDKWCRKKNISAAVTGIDINSSCIALAADRLSALDARLIVSDYAMVDFGKDKPDIIFSSLFCHHFTDEALVDMLRWMHLHARVGFFINDLHRHPLAYWSIKILTGIFSRSGLVKHDAPLSIKRGFRKKDWIKLLQEAGISVYTLQWKWAFRWLLVVNINIQR
jgi:SAM-dependent methyltransferase